MNKDIVKGKWSEMKGQLRQQWGKLTDDDVDKMQGSYEELQGKLQKAYGYNKDQSEKEIDMFLKKNKYDEERKKAA